jgi:glycosyltransferase involved in cell wall biosynthesis
MQTKLTILMPSLNEELSIAKTIKAIPVEELRPNYDIEVLIVDGGSTDQTIELAKQQGAKVIECKRGYGRQYRQGFKEARGEVIVTADSDNSYPMQEIPSLLKILSKENLDFITTNRFANIRKKAMRPLNRLGNIFLTLVVNLLFSLKLSDSQSGMWVIRKSILPKLRLTSDGMALSQEIKIEAFKKAKAKEVDSSYYKRIGKVKLRMFRDGCGNLYHLIWKRFLS